MGPYPPMAHDTTAEIERWIGRLQTGDARARDELLACACERLRRLARKMMQDFPSLARFEQSDDVLQNSAIRLSGSLERLMPHTAREFFRLAALEIRRELIDLVRHYYGPQGQGTRLAALPVALSDAPPHPAYEPPDSTNEPSKLAAWSEFHQKVESLPDEDREMFDLIWYQGLRQSEAASLLGVSERTVKRRWQHARLAVHATLNGRLP